MGKDLNGQELGLGLSQRKNGTYSARYVRADGKRVEKYFQNVDSARQWLEESRIEDLKVTPHSSALTVETWYNYWIENIKEKTVRWNTVRNYRDRYVHNIHPVMGEKLLEEVMPADCQMVLNQMESEYAYSVMNLTRIAMFNLFESAVENHKIAENPVRRSVKVPQKQGKPRRVLTLEEQNRLMEASMKSSYYEQILLVLNTGLRAGELAGLKFSDVDFEARELHVRRTLEFRYQENRYDCHAPKTANSVRTIPLTKTALDIFRLKWYQKQKNRPEQPEYKDYVFLNRNGIPVKNSCYDSALYTLAKKAHISRLSMHTLRHTFATRCIEAGMKPKTLQIILGHSSLEITMNLYVHITEDEKNKEMNIFEQYFSDHTSSDRHLRKISVPSQDISLS